MALVDTERIINATSEKRIINGYNAMRENYSESSAKDFYDIYSKEPIDYLLEHTELLFSEPYYGVEYFKHEIVSPGSCNFNSFESEYEKVMDFMDRNYRNMNESQKKVYDDLKTYMENTIEGTRNTRSITNHIKENIDDTLETKLVKLVHEGNDEKISDLLLECESSMPFFIYAPYVSLYTEDHDSTTTVPSSAISFCSYKSDFTNPKNTNYNEFEDYCEAVVACNKGSKDILYNEAVNSIINVNDKKLFNAFIKESISDTIDAICMRKENPSSILLSHTGRGAVNSLFEAFDDQILYKDDIDTMRNHYDALKAIGFAATEGVLLSEYEINNDRWDFYVEGYSFLKESTSLRNSLSTLTNTYPEIAQYFEEEITEASEDDEISDDKIDSMNSDITGKLVRPTVDRNPKANKPSLAEKIQMKAMDAESRQFKKRSLAKRSFDKIKGAAKAVVTLPLNIINDIKGMVHKIDVADDERRKKYMTQPGFRKKAFRNLKLACLYGGAANINLAYVPVAMICRHFSKEKNVRIRNEAIRELETEIKVTEEKIQDANSNNDQRQKYTLIRLKDKLNNDLVRLKTNSKYI